ncbi:hypothetical protein FHR83_006782 [Actinoplanes campanulatus]|uniref:Uncharacterized protein n=1 Tax=Actinoplanes campanulatus TaxID=113559 RepID=A0A7W5AML6_9ACTN|nr:hypothetical protein [Actinoplanes campanulatus]MBB3099076.1 hypothetical protein [Actinoplanes campanulatus]GGN39149.1 hypothetical protein GCM10010109_66760 [Actinoplanes campanulatus]GID40233.1 hypothetical protein Aca09nite_67390 [Actinoplanes campanulatus]
MLTESHTTRPADNGTYHYWEVRGPYGAVSLSLLHSRAAGFTSLARMSPALAGNLAPTESGHWVFNVIGEHRPNGPESGWSCSVHGDTCDEDAIVTDLAWPIWERLRDGGVTDRAVYAELEALAGRVFEVAA